MAGAKGVIDMRPGKGFTTSQSNEHLRRLSDRQAAKKAEWNFDLTREHLNFEIGKGGVVMNVDKTKSIPKRIQENLAERGIEDPNLPLVNQGKNPYYRTVANFILGGNREVMRNLAYGKQEVNWEKGADNSALQRMPEIEKWAKDSYQFMCDKYGEQNIVAFVVHLDEANPHVHCTVLPITNDEKMSFFKVFLNGVNSKNALSQHMTELHTEYADVVGSKYGLERGDSVKETGASHRTTEQYREWLWSEAEKKRREVESNEQTIDSQSSTIEMQRSTIENQSREIKHAAARLKGLQTMIKNLETRKADLVEELERLKRDLASGKITKDEADRKLAQINEEIKNVNDKINDKMSKLKIAQAQLESIEGRTSKAQTMYDEIEQKYNNVHERLKQESPSLNKKVLHEMQSMGFLLVALDEQDRMKRYYERRENLSQDKRDFLDDIIGNIFDGSIVTQIAENSAAIASVATALFLGYMDKATDISESYGGGGAPGNGWGKKDDEDDLAFRRRCFFTAMHMMRPANKQQRKR